MQGIPSRKKGGQGGVGENIARSRVVTSFEASTCCVTPAQDTPTTRRSKCEEGKRKGGSDPVETLCHLTLDNVPYLQIIPVRSAATSPYHHTKRKRRKRRKHPTMVGNFHKKRSKTTRTKKRPPSLSYFKINTKRTQLRLPFPNMLKQTQNGTMPIRRRSKYGKRTDFPHA